VDGNLTITALGSQLIFGITNATGVYSGNLEDLNIKTALPAVYQAAIDSLATQYGSTAPGSISDHDYLLVDGTLTLSANTRITVNNLGSLVLGGAAKADKTLIKAGSGTSSPCSCAADDNDRRNSRSTKRKGRDCVPPCVRVCDAAKEPIRP
jgi:hypothetical protein